MKDGQLYRNTETGHIFTLHKDHGGWHMQGRNAEEALKPSLSPTTMRFILRTSFELVVRV